MPMQKVVGSSPSSASKAPGNRGFFFRVEFGRERFCPRFAPAAAHNVIRAGRWRRPDLALATPRRDSLCAMEEIAELDESKLFSVRLLELDGEPVTVIPDVSCALA